MSGGHVQTILPAFLPGGSKINWRRERLELEDGDFLDLDWRQAGNHNRLALLSHGLEGSSRAVYIKGMAHALHAAGWDVLGWNYRGCSGEPNRLPRSYHSGESGDLGTVIHHAAKNYDTLALVGFSLGGNITLKYLGEASPHPKIKAGIAISTPVNLAWSARALDQRKDNRLYLKRFLKTLLQKMEGKAKQFPGLFDPSLLQDVHGFQEFDDRFTAPMHGFINADDYWTRCSSRQFVRHIQLPTLLMNARNDPFLTEESFPEPEAAASPFFHLETPQSGGHVGFLDFRKGLRTWAERRTVEFLQSQPTCR